MARLARSRIWILPERGEPRGDAHPRRGWIGVFLERPYRACLPSPVSYGVTPDISTLATDASLYKLDPDDLVSGEEYTVAVWTYCDGEPGETVEANATFTAP